MIQQWQSEQVDQIADAMSKALAEYETARKSGVNSHLRAKYANLQDVCESLQEPLSKNGFAPVTVQPSLTEAGVLVAVGCLRHKSGQWISGMLPLINPKNDMQGLGAAMTYARRVLTLSLTGAWSGEPDDDGQSIRAAVAAPAQVAADSMSIESKASQMIKEGSEDDARKALALVKLRIAEGKASKKVLERVQKLFDARFQKELVNT